MKMLALACPSGSGQQRVGEKLAALGAGMGNAYEKQKNMCEVKSGWKKTLPQHIQKHSPDDPWRVEKYHGFSTTFSPPYHRTRRRTGPPTTSTARNRHLARQKCAPRRLSFNRNPRSIGIFLCPCLSWSESRTPSRSYRACAVVARRPGPHVSARFCARAQKNKKGRSQNHADITLGMRRRDRFFAVEPGVGGTRDFSLTAAGPKTPSCGCHWGCPVAVPRAIPRLSRGLPRALSRGGPLSCPVGCSAVVLRA